KARKWMHCDGKCQLMKKIIESEKKQEQVPAMKPFAKIEVISSQSFYTTLIFSQEPISRKYMLNNIGQPADQPSSFFHPPGNLLRG
ncbi:MAG TPA: hypothetical protein VGI82_08700, partial [Chitinophagaceae bacterium]